MSELKQNKIVFGPVPSRRLGRSLGINNVPPKVCSYACIYCQVGITSRKSIDREVFYSPEQIYNEVKEKIETVGAENIDYLTFVSDGEPTLNFNLGATIERLKKFNIKTAIISNASLLWREEIKEVMNKVDYVSIKIDAVDKKIWKKINCPHRNLDLDIIRKHIIKFSRQFNGELHTETMLVKDINDDDLAIEHVADFISLVKPASAYLAVPTRPPASKKIYPVNTETLQRAARIFNSFRIHTEYLNNYEGNDFVSTNNVEQDILTITAVHPMRKDAIINLLDKAGKKWDVIEKLIKDQEIEKKNYNGNVYFLRKFSKEKMEV
ncbi:radical SAM protein [Bacteroidota bacterium]